MLVSKDGYQQFLLSLCTYRVKSVFPPLESRLPFVTCFDPLNAAEVTSKAQVLRELAEFSRSRENKVIQGERSNQLCQMLLIVEVK